MDINTARVDAKTTDYSGWELLARTFHAELPFSLYRKGAEPEDATPAKGRRRKAKSAPKEQEIDPKTHPDFTMFIATPVYGDAMNEQSLFLSVWDGWIEYHMRMPNPKRGSLSRQRANPPPANAVRGMV